jgi:hypothetical protein
MAGGYDKEHFHHRGMTKHLAILALARVRAAF